MTLKKSLAWYSTLFLATAALAFAPFVYDGRGFVWLADGLDQHFPALLYFGEWVRQAVGSLLAGQPAVKLWEFGFGYGSDVIATLHYYVLGDPLTLLAAIVPGGKLEYLYDALVVLRLYLAGLFFLLYCRHFRKEGTSALAGALVYVFCGFALYSAIRHPYFENPLVYLPLLLLGAERIFEGRSPALFVVMVFVAAISNFYFLYMLVLVLVGYCLVRCLMLHRGEGARAFFQLVGRFAGYGLLGAAMAAVMLVPVVLFFLGTGRANVQILHDPLYTLDYYKNLLTAFSDASSMDSWMMMGFSGPAAATALALFAQPHRHFWMKLCFAFMGVLFLIPAVGSALNGFSYVSNRWCWAFAFLVALVFVWVWPELRSLSRGQRVFVWGGLALYALFACLFNTEHAPAVLASVAVAALALLVASGRLDKAAPRVGRLAPQATVCLVVAGIAVNALFLYTPAGNDYVSEFAKSGSAYSRVVNTSIQDVARKMAEDGSFSRVERTLLNTMNGGSPHGVSTTEYKWSLVSPYEAAFLDDLAANVGNDRDFKVVGLGGKAYLESLAGVRYFVTDDTAAVPYGFSKVDAEGDAAREVSIYRSELALPLGYTYDAWLSPADWDSLDAMQRQEALMTAALVDERHQGALEDSALSPATPSNLRFDAVELDYQLDLGKDVGIMDDGSFAVRKAGAKVELTFEGLPDSETYVYLRGVDVQWCRGEDVVVAKDKTASLREGRVSLDAGHSKSLFTLVVASPERGREVGFSTPYYRYHAGWTDFLVQVGYTKAPQTKATITFPTSGIYHMDGLKVLCLPMQRFEGLARHLTQDTWEGESVGVNTVSGSISVEQQKLLCLGVPYSEGWSVRVDGKPAELLQVNDMFSGVLLDAGEHRIEMAYLTPGLDVGLAVSLLAWVAFLIILCIRRAGKER